MLWHYAKGKPKETLGYEGGLDQPSTVVKPQKRQRAS